MSEDQIVAILEKHGFVVQQDKDRPGQYTRGRKNINGDRPRRLEHLREGNGSSPYVAPGFACASGGFRGLEEDVPPTGYEREDLPKPFPYWEEEELARLLEVVGTTYS